MVGDGLNSPSGASTSDQVKNLAGFHRGKAGLHALTIKPRHDASEDKERRQAADTSAVERQQAKAFTVNGAWISSCSVLHC